MSDRLPDELTEADAVRGEKRTAEHLSPGAILRKTANGAGWIVGWRMARRLLGLINTLVLARLLLPSDFGVVALGTLLSGSLEAFSAVGVEDALVREKAPDRSLYDTAFTINVLRGTITALILAIVAYPAARYFGDLRLAAIIWALAACMVIGSLTNIGTVDFRRDLAFGREFVLLVLPRIGGFLVTLGVALIWRSYWALVAGIATNRVLQAVLGYVMHPYRPRLTLRAWRGLVGFSSWTWLISMALMVRDRSDSFIMGRLLGDAPVGLFAMAGEISNLPTTELVGPLGRAAFSGFSAARHSGHDTGRLYLRVISSVGLISVPIGLGISAVADPVVRLLLGPTWIQVIPLIRLLGLVGTLAAFGVMSVNLLQVHGLLRMQFWTALAFAGLRVPLLLILVPRYGVMGAAIAATIGVTMEYGVYVAICLRVFHTPVVELLHQFWRTALAGAAMTAALVLTGLGWSPTPGGEWAAARHLIAAGSVGATTYGLVILAAWLAAGRPAGPEVDFASLLKGRFPALQGRVQGAFARLVGPGVR